MTAQTPPLLLLLRFEALVREWCTKPLLLRWCQFVFKIANLHFSCKKIGFAEHASESLSGLQSRNGAPASAGCIFLNMSKRAYLGILLSVLLAPGWEGPGLESAVLQRRGAHFYRKRCFCLNEVHISGSWVESVL